MIDSSDERKYGIGMRTEQDTQNSLGTAVTFFAAAAFIILAPVSTATEMDAAGPAKYLRLASSALVVLAGFAFGGGHRFGRCTIAFLPFVALWTISPIWSGSPVWGLFHKGMFTLVFLAGTLLACTPGTLGELKSGLKFLGGVATLAAGSVFIAYLRDPGGSLTHGRLAVGGINANTIGQTAAPLAMFCVYAAINTPKFLFRAFAGGGLAVLVMILVLSGSRGGIAMAAIGCAIQLIPAAKRIGTLLLGGGLIAGAVVIAIDLIESSGVEEVRAIGELTKDTRSGIWKAGMKAFMSDPVLGKGWLYQGSGKSWATLQSAYLQVLAETGIVGAVMLLGAMSVAAFGILAIRQRVASDPETRAIWYLSTSCVVASLFHGAIESSMVLGTALTPLTLGFGLGLVDRMSSLNAPSAPQPRQAPPLRQVSPLQHRSRPRPAPFNLPVQRAGLPRSPEKQ